MRKLLFILAFIISAVIPVTAQDTYRDPADLADADGKFMTVNDASIYYLDRGPVDGKPIILLHGFLGSVVDWTNTIPALTDAGFRVIAFDRPPFGLSDKRTDLDYSTQAMSNLTAGVMDALNIEQAVIVGHSLGGAVASQFVLDYPTRVTRLVLVDAAIGIMGSNPQFDMRPNGGGRNNGNNNTGVEFLSRVNPDSPAAQALVRGMFSPEFANNMMAQSMSQKHDIDPAEMQRRTRGLQIKGWEGGVLAFTRDAFSDKSEIELDAFKTVQTPVLIIWGQDDRIVPIEVGEALRELFPHNTWITYPQVGHTAMDENTTQFNADLVTFASAN